jgi:hypothetical protein
MAGRKQARAIGEHCGRRLGSGVILPAGHLFVLMKFHPGTLRSFDVDNAVAAMKGYLDGLFEALGRDDKDIRAVFGLERPKISGGRVVIDLLPLSVATSWSAVSSLLD